MLWRRRKAPRRDAHAQGAQRESSPAMDQEACPPWERWDLAELVPAYLTIHDKDFRILHANRAFTREFPDWRHRRCFELCRGEDSQCDGCELQVALSEGKEASWEETLITTEGERVHLLARAVPITPSHGDGPVVMKVAFEIGEIKRRVKQLEMSKNEYKALFEGMPCYISIVDRDHTIIRTNKYFERDLGRPIGRKCYEAYGGREAPCLNCPVERTLEDGHIHSSEQTFRFPSGDHIQAIVYAAPIMDLKGEVFAAMEMSANISEVKRLQRELAMLGQAVAVTSHSVKNILNGLKGGAYVVQSGLKKGDHQIAQQGWEMVREGVEMISQLVSDVLVLSKKRRPQYKPINPSELAMTVWKLFQRRAQDLGIALGLEADQKTIPRLWADANSIHTALSNLVSNAIEACMERREHGPHRVVIRVMSSPEGGVIFEVEDTGGGIPPQVQERLFQEVLSTKGSHGTGLGLLVTEKIVSEHGGKVEFESRPGQGTLFRIFLPQLHQRPHGQDEPMEHVDSQMNNWLLGGLS